MVLEARRAIERETSRLAALRATRARIDEMKRVARAHLRGVRSGAIETEHDVSLHRLIARSAGNVLLGKILDLIRGDREVAAVVRKARERSHLQCAHEHEAIVRAIAARDPVGAEEAMTRHLDGLIEAVRASFAQTARLDGLGQAARYELGGGENEAGTGRS
jgi:GntR family L-lactate dehydrogenase operon transcriptional regulator